MKMLSENSTVVSFAERILLPIEKVSKEFIFDCRMCGQCILHETGLTCPMRCPKNLRNGPCGGVRPNGNCEVYPDKPCVWVQAVERSAWLPLWRGRIQHLQLPVDWQLQDTSAWINLFTGRDAVHPQGWKPMPDIERNQITRKELLRSEMQE